MRPPRTINAALLVGFVVIFAVWLTSTFYFTRHLTITHQRNAAMHARYARGQQLLAAVRSEVLLSSIYVRDALIEAEESFSAAAAARDQLRSLQAQVSHELEQYEAIAGVADRAGWAQLEAELAEYWAAAARLVAVGPDTRAGTAEARLHTQVVPRRNVILELSDDIRRLLDDAFRREQEELEAANRIVGRRIWETTAVAVLVGFAIATLSTWYARRLETAVREEHAELARNRLELQHLSGRLVRAQEDERRSIARELHDEIGQALTAVDVELALAEGAVGGVNGGAATAIGEARAVVRRALGGVRDLSQLLRPSMLDDFGLPDTLKWYLRKFSDRTGVRTQLVDDRLEERLPIDVEVCVYRAIQEALTNVSRHAQATNCRVVVQRQSASVIVTIEDDGIGLAPGPPALTRRTGLGLVGIRERVSDLGGTFRIDGQPGRGTRLTIELPVSAAA